MGTRLGGEAGCMRRRAGAWSRHAQGPGYRKAKHAHTLSTAIVIVHRAPRLFFERVTCIKVVVSPPLSKLSGSGCAHLVHARIHVSPPSPAIKVVIVPVPLVRYPRLRSTFKRSQTRQSACQRESQACRTSPAQSTPSGFGFPFLKYIVPYTLHHYPAPSPRPELPCAGGAQRGVPRERGARRAPQVGGLSAGLDDGLQG